jgi:hypothetical protein
LFINEYGDIDHVKIEKSGLPEEAERLIADAFSKTKFYPGRIDRTAVKTQLKIEIAIESVNPQADDSAHGNTHSPSSQTFEMEYVPNE